MRISLSVVSCLGFVVCLGAASGYQQPASGYQKPTDAELRSNIPTSPVKHCSSQNGLPDSTCTPGVTRTVTLDEICKGPSTSTIRPLDTYTDALKKAQIVEYGWTDTNPADYEEDHLISLELEATRPDPKNLWPEPYAGNFNSHMKDKVEDWLHAQVCSGKMTLEQAQNGIKTNWEQYISAASAPNAHTRHPAPKTQ